MIGQIDPATLAPLLSGPASAVAVLVGVGIGVYRIVAQMLIPLLSRAVDRHLGQIDELLKNQKAESKAITATLASIDRRLARLEDLTDSRRIDGGPATN
jgi:hypothetical protein